MLIPNKHSGYQTGIRLYPGGGKGGSSAPPPDPRLVEAQIKSMGLQDQAIQKMMEQSDELAPLQKEQMQFGLDTSRTAYDQSQADREWTLDRRGKLTGVQDTFLKDAADFNEGDRGEQLAGMAMEDVTNAYGTAQGMTDRALSARGISASSGAAMDAINGNGVSMALARASAANKVREAARMERYSLNDRAANALSGYPAMGMSATGAGAGYGSSGLGMTNSALSGLNSGWNSAGGMAGQLGSNATGMYNAQASYQIGMDKNAQSESDPFGAMLGKGLGALATSYGGSFFPVKP
jgi:hypothetical protein